MADFGLGPAERAAIAEMEAFRIAVDLGACPHFNAVPVNLIGTDEVVAWLCPECDSQLPVEWKRPTFGLAAVLGIEVPRD